MWLGVWHLVAAQLVGDYPLQPGALLRWKMRSLAGILAHSVVLTACAAVALAPDLHDWWWVVLAFGALHYVLDWGKLSLAPRYPGPRVVLYLQDQLQDFGGIVALVGAGHLAGLPRPRGILGDRPEALYVLIGYLLVTFFASILILEVRRSLPHRPRREILTYRERVPGFVERGAALTAVLAGIWALVPLVFVPRAVLAIRTACHREDLLLGATVVGVCGLWLQAFAL